MSSLHFSYLQGEWVLKEGRIDELQILPAWPVRSPVRIAESLVPLAVFCPLRPLSLLRIRLLYADLESYSTLTAQKTASIRQCDISDRCFLGRISAYDNAALPALHHFVGDRCGA